ncbi:MAG: pyrophosphatase PpaX [Dethiobacteria bacterium]|jgi:pyrophosphatase PpaX|nr:pyrophosphatase PpaX [Bacillota bacterium]
MIKAVLFDLDGTLIDTYELIIESYNNTFKKYLGFEVPREELIGFIGEPLMKTMARYAEGEQLKTLVKAYRDFNIKNHDRLAKPFPGVDKGLAELKKAGYKLIVVTSKMRDTAYQGLELFKLTSFFEDLVGFEDTKEHKPGPAPVLKALDILGVSPEEALMIGDSTYDLYAAHGAGVVCGIVSYSIYPPQVWEAKSPDFWLESIDKLLPLIESGEYIKK